MPFLLDLIYLLVALVTAPWWMRKQRGGWRERFGRIEPLPGKTRPRALIHAVSVGEVNLVRLLVDRLRDDFDVVVSTTTDTGLARARDLYENVENVHVRRYPLDASWAVRRFLDRTQPDVVALAELELWPNFLSACTRRGIPVTIVNGRLSERSFGRYRLARPILGRWFKRLAHVAVQDETYASRFKQVGAPADRITVTGSMKWDTAATGANEDAVTRFAEEMRIDRARPLIVAGSTAPDEHQLLHDATPDDAQLLCAPRRPEWWDDAADALDGCVRRSAVKRGEPAPEHAADRFLLDTIGELRLAYALADVAVVGRSFGELHGSDPMEPAALGKPVVIGPAVADFQESVDALRMSGGLVQTTRADLASTLESLMNDESRRRDMARRARECVLANQGATARNAELIESLLRPPEAAP